jgi:hypothetical protein
VNRAPDCRQQLHLRQQDHARGGRADQHRGRRHRGPNAAEVGRPSLSEMQAQGGCILPGENS